MNTENDRCINDCENEILKIMQWAEENKFHSNVRFLVNYAVIKASGTTEIVFKSLLHSFLSEGCKTETQKFLEKRILDLSCNPSTGNMERLLDQIDPKRKKAFSEKIKGTPEQNDLNSLVSIRNDIAHGRSVTTTITNVKRCFESGKIIINILDSILNSN